MSVATVPKEPTMSNTSLSRRSLFPCEADSESDSDLGHISPLNFDSSFEQDHFKGLTKLDQNVKETVGDYDILEVVENNYVDSTPKTKYSTQDVMSPLYLSPYCSKLDIIDKTPSKTSPSFTLKTPHDAPNTNSKLPKLSRKSLLDSEVASNSNKRKMSPEKSPDQNKQIKLDPKSCRVRTTLFPEVDFALPTKSFYPKSDDIMPKILSKRELPAKSAPKVIKRSKTKPRKRIGQINAGVRHCIRKPKQKKVIKPPVKSSANGSGNAAITEYILDLKELRTNNNPTKLIENKENTQLPQKMITPAVIPPTPIKQDESRKRPLSPTEPEQNRKFFKHSTNKSTIKENSKINLLGEKKKVINEFDDDYELPNNNVNNIISFLDNYEVPEENKVVLKVSHYAKDDNSIILHQTNCAADVLLSPISQMCDVTSGLALNSPKKFKNLTPILDKIENVESETHGKLFPVFYPDRKVPVEKKTKTETHGEKKLKKLPRSQTILDAGQKKFGLTQCYECQFVYNAGDSNEEIMHLDYHSGRHVFRFLGWKNERVVADFFNNGRIIQILPNDSKFWWKKVSDLMNAINMELGSYDMEFRLKDCQAFLYIKQKKIIGTLVATPKSEGYQIVTPEDGGVDTCLPVPFGVKCGVQRIWVSPDCRKNGIATKMMNVLKGNFMMGYILDNSDIAFSSPTDAGKQFAYKYFKTQNFLIYTD